MSVIKVTVPGLSVQVGARSTARGEATPHSASVDSGRGAPPKCNVDTYAEVGWFRLPKISKDISTEKPRKKLKKSRAGEARKFLDSVVRNFVHSHVQNAVRTQTTKHESDHVE